MKETPVKNKLNVKVDDDVVNGKYANLGSISSTPDEFFLDFLSVPPGSKEAKVVSRVIVSPGHAKRFANALLQNVQNYEQKFGEIKSFKPPAGQN